MRSPIRWLASVCLAAIVATVDLPSYPFARYAETQETYQRVINPHARHMVIPVERRDDQGRILWVATTVTFLTASTSYSVPADWNNSDNTIECIGAGGDTSTTGGGGGAGGGAYALKNNVTLTPSGTATYQIGSSGGTITTPSGTAHTWFSSNTTVRGAGAASATTSSGTAGGSTANSIGNTTFAGGNGGNGNAGNGGGGGGGAAGPDGAGKNGGNGGVAGQGGGGGGGSNGGTAGGSSSSSSGGTAGQGTNSSGDGGDGGNNNAAGSSGLAGDNFNSVGSGGGAGGGGDSATGTSGRSGGSKGGGASGAGGASGGTAGNGSAGLIVVTYTAAVTPPYGFNTDDVAEKAIARAKRNLRRAPTLAPRNPISVHLTAL